MPRRACHPLATARGQQRHWAPTVFRFLTWFSCSAGPGPRPPRKSRHATSEKATCARADPSADATVDGCKIARDSARPRHAAGRALARSYWRHRGRRSATLRDVTGTPPPTFANSERREIDPTCNAPRTKPLAPFRAVHSAADGSDEKRPRREPLRWRSGKTGNETRAKRRALWARRLVSPQSPVGLLGNRSSCH